MSLFERTRHPHKPRNVNAQMSHKVASRADLWYNKHINVVLPQRCYQHPAAWIHLLLKGRCIMDTLPPYAPNDNPHYILIPLTRGKFAMVDFDDADLAEYKWCINSRYASRNVKQKPLFMHRVVLERKLQRPIQDEMLGDHINGNELDNRRSNLREATRTQNAWNSGTQKNNTSQYTGVSYIAGFYRARLGSSGAILGSFKTALDASFCYDREALARWGDYARLNHSVEEILAWQPPQASLFSSNTSGYRGVSELKSSGKWQASYRQRGGKLHHLGTFDTAEDAARAYDRMAIQFNGRRAIYTNFPREEYEDG